MIITKPIYFIRAKGNIKKSASEDNESIITSFEEHLNETWVVINFNPECGVEDIKNKYLDMGAEDVLIVFSENGINFKTFT